MDPSIGRRTYKSLNRYGLAIVRVFREARRRKVFRTGALYVALQRLLRTCIEYCSERAPESN